MTGPLRLTNAHVVLRDFTSEDADDAYAIVGDDRVTRWLSFDSKAYQETVDMVAGIVKRAQQTPPLRVLPGHRATRR
jgi:ribosomal-protein-alanine N-acetyltransferase